MDLIELKKQSASLLDRCQGIQSKSETERRNMTAEEQAEYDRLYRRFLANEQEILSQGTGRKTSPEGPNSRMRGGSGSSGAGVIVGKTKGGEEVRAYRPNESLPVSGPVLPFDFGAWMRRCWNGTTGDIRADAMTESAGADGGFAVPQRMAAEILDIVRNKAQVLNAGALTIPMDSRELELVKQIGDPTAYWRGELEAIPPSKMTFAMQTFRAHSLAATITLSEELLADAKNFGAMLQNALGSALALALDKACLSGTGIVQPLGILNTPGVQTTGAVGTLADYGDFSEAAGKL
jgi:HK97 family phage major capsid protein